MDYSVNLFDEQQKAFFECMSFITNEPKSFRTKRLKARGGTGKTFTIKSLVSYLSRPENNVTVAVVAFTGRAASQISGDGVAATTIHSYLYKPRIDNNGDLIGWDRRDHSELRQFDAICVDEGSMVPESVFKDLKSVGIPILVLGDDIQLPPVDPDGNPDYNLMSSFCDHEFTHPDSTLMVNRRTDPKYSGIVDLMNTLTEVDSIPRRKGNGLSFVPKGKIMSVRYHQDEQFDIVLCGMNKTRKKINDLIRTARGFDTDIPQVGERVICLRNDILGGNPVNNGDLFTVEGVLEADRVSKFFLRKDGAESTICVSVFNDTWKTEKTPKTKDMNNKLGCFTFGYCVSVHKSQGSTFNSVLFYDEDVSFFLDRQRFRYTAVSRAAEKLVVGI